MFGFKADLDFEADFEKLARFLTPIDKDAQGYTVFVVDQGGAYDPPCGETLRQDCNDHGS